MKIVAVGPTAGVGVVVPFDFALDRELWRWVPEDAALHVTRTPAVPAPVTADMARAISEAGAVRRATRDVLEPGPGVVAYACTSGSFVDGAAGEAALTRVIREAGAPAALTTSGALVEGMRAVGATRVAVVTPYVDDLTRLLEEFLSAHGIETVHSVGLGLLGRIWEVGGDEVVAAVRAADRPDADAVFVSCTNLATYDVIASLERELGKPVLTANQVTMWAALRAIGRQAVGPGQALVDGRGTAVGAPVLAPGAGEPASLPDGGLVFGSGLVVGVGPVRFPEAGFGPGSADERSAAGGVPVLHNVRVRLPDESGALARLTDAVARAGGNILGLAVHGQDSRSVVDEMVVGSRLTTEQLAAAIRGAVGAHDPGAVLVTPADPHDLVDGPTRALDLAMQASGGPADLARGLASLVHADDAGWQPDEPAPHPHVLSVPAPGGGHLVATREWAPFTVTEAARAQAFLRAAEPTMPRWDIVLLSGDELVATPATGGEVAAAEELLCECLAGDAAPAASWTDEDLRALLGEALLVRDGAGRLVALGGSVEGEIVLLVHPDFRGLRLGRWLRRRLTARSPLAV
ncbi:hypothetical protein GCM10009836_41430 [Pseudonocardia ailaonensis]|uniref:ACT domain-containing protein n=1 Tax=Pseudonocardia ailaonensis TaxID=367279 RepID=A0ABN2N8K3_9PSEU